MPFPKGAHLCSCGDCNPEPYHDWCKFEVALRDWLNVYLANSRPSGELVRETQGLLKSDDPQSGGEDG
jgi:hypothetical protein